MKFPSLLAALAAVDMVSVMSTVMTQSWVDFYLCNINNPCFCLNLFVETGAEQNTHLKNVSSQSFPKWFSDPCLYGTLFLLTHATPACRYLFLFQAWFFEKQVLSTFSILVMMTLKQYFYYFPHDFF